MQVVRGRVVWVVLGAGLAGVIATATVSAQDGVSAGDWSYFGGTTAFMRYTPLNQIDRHNVANLQILWRRPAVDAVFTRAFPELRPSNYLRSTPILVNGLLYASNAIGLVEAFDSGTGETVWMQQPLTPTLEGVAGRAAHGVAYWADGADRRILSFRNTNPGNNSTDVTLNVIGSR